MYTMPVSRKQNAMGIAAGLTATGKTVFMHSFGPFASRRAFDPGVYVRGLRRPAGVHVIGSDPGVLRGVQQRHPYAV